MVKVAREVTIARETRAWDLRQQGWTHERIAADLGVDRSTVTRILGRLSARYMAALAKDVDQVKGGQIAQLEYIADEAMQAWERSKAPGVTRTRKTVTLKNKTDEGLVSVPAVELTRRVEYQVGEATYLSTAMDALGAIRKILGADAPAKIEATGKDGAPLHPDHAVKWDELTDAELDAIIAAAERGRAASAGGESPPG
jgi:hypothetical protein